MTRYGKWSYCCGAGGKISQLCYPDFADAIGKERLKEAKDAAGYLVTACPICYHHMRKTAKREKTDIKLYDFVVFAAEAMGLWGRGSHHYLTLNRKQKMWHCNRNFKQARSEEPFLAGSTSVICRSHPSQKHTRRYRVVTATNCNFGEKHRRKKLWQRRFKKMISSKLIRNVISLEI